MNKLNNKVRDVRLDIVRIFGVFCIIAFHFFGHSGFYNEIVIGKRMYIMCIIRSFFVICVPTFIMLTGYLVNNKKLSKKYYKGIIKILIIYLICSIVYSIFIKCYTRETMNINVFLKNLLSYNGTNYAWYIEMYIGLFLIIPFLNIIINNLKNKKEYQVLLGTLIFIMGLPSVLNSFGFKILPDWWMGIYPIFYYFLGAYLNRFPIKLSTKYNIIFLIIFTVFDGSFNFYKSFNGNFIWESWNGQSSIFVIIESFLVFNLLLKIKFKKNNNIRNKVLEIVSNACLGAYLISCMYDRIIYDKLSIIVPQIKQRFIYAPITVIICFAFSILTSLLINLIYNGISKIHRNDKRKQDMKTILLASNNKHKLKEFKEILKDYNIITLSDIGYFDDIKETGKTFEENAIIKAETVHNYLKEKKLDYIVVSEDSGLCVNSLNGAPGIYSARYAGGHGNDKENRDKLRKELKNKDREAYFICTIVVYYPNGTHKTFVGKTFGKIIDEELGKKDFGYDCIFYSNDLSKTFGQASKEEKNSVSHRSRAIQKILEVL